MTRRAPKHGHKKYQPKHKRPKERKGELTRAKQFVRNSSSHQLTIPEIKVLAKGLIFIPFSGQPQKQAVIASLKEMGRKINCRTKFGDDNSPTQPLYTNTGFDPGRVDPTTDAYLDETRILEEMNISQASSQQLTNEERKALINLKNLDHIVILKADKNSTIVVMDKDDYIKEGLRQLASIHYTEVTDAPDPNQLMRTIDDLLEANQIDKTTHRFLSQTAKQNSWGKMSLLPKVHKLSSEEIIQAETHSPKSLNKTLPGRPITAQCGSPTYYIGKPIDILLLPIVKRQNTYIRDTPNFIRMIESLQASPNCTLVAHACTSMYTNIEFNELKQAVNDVLPQVVSCQGLNNTVQKHHVVRLVETLLTNNYFSFNGKLYHQTIGAYMGEIPSPEICDIRLHQLLEHLIKNSPHKNKIITHVRFRDDGFMIWENARRHNELLSHGQQFPPPPQIHPLAIKARNHLFGYDSVQRKKFNELQNIGYQNPPQTNGDVSIPPPNIMPPRLSLSWIHKRKSSQESAPTPTLANFKTKLIERGYKIQEIDQYFSETLPHDRKSLLADRPKNNKIPLVYITKYHPHLKNLRKALTKGWDRIKKSPTTTVP